jgi:hypothetical protein
MCNEYGTRVVLVHFLDTYDGSQATPLHARQFREFALVRRIRPLNPTHEVPGCRRARAHAQASASRR